MLLPALFANLKTNQKLNFLSKIFKPYKVSRRNELKRLLPFIFVKNKSLNFNFLFKNYIQITTGLSYNFEKLCESTDNYSSIPTQWREPVNEKSNN